MGSFYNNEICEEFQEKMFKLFSTPYGKKRTTTRNCEGRRTNASGAYVLENSKIVKISMNSNY